MTLKKLSVPNGTNLSRHQFGSNTVGFSPAQGRRRRKTPLLGDRDLKLVPFGTGTSFRRVSPGPSSDYTRSRCPGRRPGAASDLKYEIRASSTSMVSTAWAILCFSWISQEGWAKSHARVNDDFVAFGTMGASHEDGRWFFPAFIPPSMGGNEFGVRWPSAALLHPPVHGGNEKGELLLFSPVDGRNELRVPSFSWSAAPPPSPAGRATARP